MEADLPSAMSGGYDGIASTPRPTRPAESLAGLVRTAAAEPHRVAVRDSTGTYTYGDLWAVARRAADEVTDRVPAGARVGIGLEPGFLAMAAIVGVVAASCTYVPLDPRYPTARLQHIARDAELALTLAAPESLAAAVAAGAPVTSIPDGDREPGQAQLAVTGDVPAYVIYTSGTTGEPKGVEIPQAAVLYMLASCLPLLDLGPSEVWLLGHSLSFDFSVFEMWGCFATGGALVVPRAEERRDPEALIDLLAEARVTTLCAVPGVFSHLAFEMEEEARQPLALRRVIFGGERLDRDAIARWRASTPAEGVAWHNLYGITETTVHATHRRLSTPDLQARTSATPIGLPLATTQIVVLDPGGHEAPTAQVGEMYVGGPQLALGYVNDAEQTARAFVALPERPGRWYKTGDLAYRAHDGSLWAVGRADAQVKVRGFRLELEEVDAHLRACAGIAAAAAAAVDRGRGNVLVALVVADAGADLEPAILNDELRSRVPEHLLPSDYRVVSRLPLTPTGKVDRRAVAAAFVS